MRYANGNAFRRALEDRLNRQSQGAPASLVRLRKLVAFDRLLARLRHVAPERWLLKGALAIDYRINGQYRTTRDIDLWRPDGPDEALSDFLAAQLVDLGDYFEFRIHPVARPLLEDADAASRYQVVARLADRRFEDFHIDVGFIDRSVLEPATITGPDLLSFAEIEPVTVRAIPLEQQIAEKVHAYCQTYADGRTNSRVKDLFDLVLVRSLKPYRASDLRLTLVSTFEVRGATPPRSFPKPPEAWVVPFGRLANEVGMSADLALAYDLTAAFLDPVLSNSINEDARWSAERSNWT